MQNTNNHLEKGFSKKVNSLVVLLFFFSILYPITTEGIQNQGAQPYLQDENPSQQSSSPALSLFAGISEYNFSKLSSGMYNYHMCGLTNSSDLLCWGANSNSQLGIGATGDVSSPTQVFASNNSLGIVNVTTGLYHSCIIVSSGDVECWGKGSLGRLGTGSTANLGSATSRVLLPTNSTAVSIDAGEVHTCAVLDNGSAYCWGNNQGSKLGDGTTTDRSTPVFVKSLGSTVSHISAGLDHTCALLSNNKVKCWGQNSEGETGINPSSSTITYSPNEISFPSGLTPISVTTGKEISFDE